MKTWRTFLLAVLLATTTLISCFAQTAPAATSMISVPVVVSNATGAAVPDLSANDFSADLNGAPASLTLAKDLKPVTVPTASGNEVSNSLPPGSPPVATIIVVDVLDTRYVEEGNLRTQVFRGLQRLSEAKQPFALYTFTQDGLHMVHNPRLNPKQTVAVLQRAEKLAAKTPNLEPENSDPAISEDANRIAAFLQGKDANSTSSFTPLKFNPVLMFYTMQQIATAYAGLPGRKSLVWMTSVMPFHVNTKDGHLDFEPLIANGAPGTESGRSLPTGQGRVNEKEYKRVDAVWRQTLGMLQDASVSLYPALSTGLSVTQAGREWEATETNAGFQTLAALTGGRFSLSSNDLASFLASAAADNSNSYMLVIDHGKSKQDWNRLNVNVKRPGLKVVAPLGLAPSVSAKDDVARQQDLASALQSPIDYTGVIFSTSATTSEGSGAKKKVTFLIKLPPDTDVLSPTQPGIDLDVAILANTVEGKKVDQKSERDTGQLDANGLSQLRQLGMGLNNEIELPPGDYRIHVALRNNHNDHIGTVTVPLTVK